MRIIKIVFLVLSILLPLMFIILAIINFKSVKKSRKSKFRITVAIIILFTFNFTIHKLINVNEEYKTINNTKPNIVVDAPHKNESEVIKEVENSSVPLLNGMTSKGMKIHTENGVTTINDIIIVNKNYTLSKDYIPSNTSKKIFKDTKICATCLVEYVYSAFLDMQLDASKAKLKIWVQSGYRSYDYQKLLYEGYVKRDGEEKASLYSAKAGQSEHQTGLALDLNSVSDSFANTKEGKWVNDNAYKYGFIIRYPKNKESETGYKYEPWHLRYVGLELAKELYNDGDWISLEDYLGIIM